MTDSRSWIGEDGNLYVTREVILSTPEGEDLIVHEFIRFIDTDGEIEWEEYDPGEHITFVRGSE